MNDLAPTIAVVIANYNYGRYLARAIESVLGQDVPFTQVVVVDDGSTDDSLEVARTFADRVTVIAKQNGGQLGACFAGIDAVDSDYVYLMDADDAAEPHLVSRVRSELADRPVLVQFQLRAVDGEGVRTGSVFPTYPEQYDAARMRRDIEVMGVHQFAPTSGNVFRRDALLALDRTSLDLRDAPDGPIAFAMPYLGSVAVIPEPLALYRVHGSNRSQWFAPTPELLRHELTWFKDRWTQTCTILGRAQPPFAGSAPVYELELDFLVAALEGRRWLGGKASRYIRGLSRTQGTRASVLALQLWALALVVPSSRLRRNLIMQRRAPAERSPLLRRVISIVLRFRR